MTPAELSRDLREDQSPDMINRRWVLGLSMAGGLIGQIVSLYQMGIIKYLPNPPVGPFDSDKVNASDYAYKRGSTPDAMFMRRCVHAVHLRDNSVTGRDGRRRSAPNHAACARAHGS